MQLDFVSMADKANDEQAHIILGRTRQLVNYVVYHLVVPKRQRLEKRYIAILLRFTGRLTSSNRTVRVLQSNCNDQDGSHLAGVNNIGARQA